MCGAGGPLRPSMNHYGQDYVQNSAGSHGMTTKTADAFEKRDGTHGWGRKTAATDVPRMQSHGLTATPFTATHRIPRRDYSWGTEVPSLRVFAVLLIELRPARRCFS
jgi:hypothetical protein